MSACSGQTDGQTDTHALYLGAFATLLTRRSCFHGDIKVASEQSGWSTHNRQCKSGGEAEAESFHAKARGVGASGRKSSSFHSYFHPLELGPPKSPLTLLVQSGHINELLVASVTCYQEQ